jgi:hypothetical protein
MDRSVGARDSGAALNSLTLVHIVAATALPFALVAAAYRAGTRAGRVAAGLAGVLGALALAAGAVRQRAWEPGYRRAVYLASRGAGLWLDRKAHLGIAACCLAVAAALTALDAHTPRWLARALCAAAAALALAAFAAVAYVHARVPAPSIVQP